jgi:ATP-dependent helicase/nuclease subunit A
MASEQPRFDFESADAADNVRGYVDDRDAHARALAIDPTRNVVLEASAGTGKTRVLVDRYVGLLLSGVTPRNILAITFTRKAAAEMRQRILDDLARRYREGGLTNQMWRDLRESVTDIAISTIDAFCLTLLREFPLEADVDPGFELADETETPRLVGEALDKTLRIGRALTIDSPDVALLFAELGEYRLREGLARLIDRRLVADPALIRFLRANAGEVGIDAAVNRLRSRLRAAFASAPGGLEGFLACGPRHADFELLADDLRQLLGTASLPPPIVQALLERVRDHLLTQSGEPRKRLSYRKDEFRSSAHYERHAAGVAALGPYLIDALAGYRREINVVLARAVRRLLSIALQQYDDVLRKYGVLDFSEVLARTLLLLGQMDEFSRSRYKLEARYQHVLVDEFQDTSRAQWKLVELLVRSWSEGLGLSGSDRPPTVFIVGDRKQSIYGFRDAEVAVLDQAAQFIEALRPIGQVRTAITRSFRSVREILAFANDLFAAVDKAPERSDAFRYTEDDLFPVAAAEATEGEPLALIGAVSDEAQAEAVAEEIARLLGSGAVVRDRDTGVRRAARPADIGVLFRTRESHRVFEDALARRRVPFYVYKGLGFFDADEIKDVFALIGFLANPASELRAAAFLRSRFVRLSDCALKLLAPNLAGAITSPDPPAAVPQLSPYDRVRLELARAHVPTWVSLVDRLSPAELLDRVLAESAYAAELDARSYRQARENLKKVRSLVRRIQNRGYATLERIVDHLSQLAAGGDESNAIVDAVDAVNLMTVHAAKGLEFPIVFIVNLSRGSGGAGEGIRIVAHGAPDDDTASVAIGEYQSEADADLDAKETEEAKRLLYVAVTRARDRVYLAATLNADGRFAPAKGSLGRVMPVTMCEALARAGAPDAGDAIVWTGENTTHTFRVLRASGLVQEYAPADVDRSARIDAFGPLTDREGVSRIAATHRPPSLPVTSVPASDLRPLQPPPSLVAGTEVSGGDGGHRQGRRSLAGTEVASRLIGVLVHRALQSGLASTALDHTTRRARFEQLLRPHERAVINDVGALLDRAESAFEALAANQDLAARLASAHARMHEVPFSLRQADGTIVRGAIDALVEYPDGRMEILEFKAGQPHPEHERQLALYLIAARALFPGVTVEGRLVYAERQLSGQAGV